MSLQLLRGHVKDLTPPGKNGTADCHIGKYQYNVKVYRDLVNSVGKGGDDVLVAGELRNDVFHAMAVKNLNIGKTAQIDGTNTILLLGASGFICGLGLTLSLKGFNSVGIFQALNTAMAFIGLIGMAITLRRLFLFTRAANLVSRADH